MPNHVFFSVSFRDECRRPCLLEVGSYSDVVIACMIIHIGTGNNHCF